MGNTWELNTVTLFLLSIALMVVFYFLGFFMHRHMDEYSRKRILSSRPKRIILIRHGESLANIDRRVYATVPDNQIELSDRGRSQAWNAGKQLRELLGPERISHPQYRIGFFVSPYRRTKDTLEYLLKGFGPVDKSSILIREDSRLREQEFGNFQRHYAADDHSVIDQIQQDRTIVGRFWYRFKDGESGADVFDRVTAFIETMYREIDRPPSRGKLKLKDLVLVCHGLTMRMFLMRYFRWTVAQFEQAWNPDNCAIWILELNKSTGKYKMATPIFFGEERTSTIPEKLMLCQDFRHYGSTDQLYLKLKSEDTQACPVDSSLPSVIDESSFPRSTVATSAAVSFSLKDDDRIPGL